EVQIVMLYAQNGQCKQKHKARAIVLPDEEILEPIDDADLDDGDQEDETLDDDEIEVDESEGEELEEVDDAGEAEEDDQREHHS
ncbi:hypothetical protein ACLBSJ_33115, partial [Klebsiella pneumoniae]